MSRNLPRVAVALVAVAVPLALLPAAASAAFGDRSLRSGSHGHDVRVLQDWLTRLGHDTGVDGRYGRGTARSVRAYERAERIRVDGRVSRAQARRIREEVTSGGARDTSTDRTPTAVTGRATLSSDGRTAVAPTGAPAAVAAAIAAANEITDTPYRYGGGHGDFEDRGYDCSGAVSYALHGAGLLDSPLASRALMSWGERGAGTWITVYAHGGHAYAVIAGLRFDTSGRGERGPRWREEARSPSGFTARHPAGL